MQKAHSSALPIVHGPGQLAGTFFLARIAAKAFAREVGIAGLKLGSRPDLDCAGFFAFQLTRGARVVNVGIPGLTMPEMKRKNIWGFDVQKILVDGAGWGWNDALYQARIRLWPQLGVPTMTEKSLNSEIRIFEERRPSSAPPQI